MTPAPDPDKPRQAPRHLRRRGQDIDWVLVALIFMVGAAIISQTVMAVLILTLNR